jgi:transcription antitermination protein NusB
VTDPLRRIDPRHQAREAALQVLYEWEVRGDDVARILDSWRNSRPELLNDGLEVVWPRLDDELWAITERLARSTAQSLSRIDQLIERRAENWRLERMPVVDRLILRLAIGEFLTSPETPRPVAINEALELARTYSTEPAVKFINGVLDAVSRDLDEQNRESSR